MPPQSGIREFRAIRGLFRSGRALPLARPGVTFPNGTFARAGAQVESEFGDFVEDFLFSAGPGVTRTAVRQGRSLRAQNVPMVGSMETLRALGADELTIDKLRLTIDSARIGRKCQMPIVGEGEFHANLHSQG